MTDKFHLRSLIKRFPKSWALYKNEVGISDSLKDLNQWIESKGYDSRYYSISLKKIENGL